MIDEKLAKETKTRTTRAIFPGETNHYQTLFGGTALNWMDEIAFITATRYGRKKFVTVSSDRIDFKNSIPEGSIVELIGEVIQVGNTSLVVKVEIVVEDMYSRNKHVAVDGNFTFVAIDDHKKPIKIHD